MGKLLVYLTVGILCGPSGFNFPVPSWMGSVLSGASLFYLIVAGLELNLRAHRSWFRQSLLIALFSFSIPFFFGFWMGGALGTESFSSRWILATALSVSALPVIIQILRERKLLGSQTGNIVICAASLCDISAWLCFLWILPGNYSQAWAQSHLSVLMFLLAAVLSSAFKLPDQAVQSLKTCSQWVAAPLFFSGIGLQIDIWQSLNIFHVLIIFAVASASKILGAYLGSRLAKVPNFESWLIAVSLNTRGAMEIMLASMALKADLIEVSMFTSLVMMAVLTSVLAGPALQLIQRRQAKLTAAVNPVL